MEPLIKSKILNESTIEHMFCGNDLPVLLSTNKKLAEELKVMADSTASDDELCSALAEAFTKIMPFFAVYGRFWYGWVPQDVCHRIDLFLTQNSGTSSVSLCNGVFVVRILW